MKGIDNLFAINFYRDEIRSALVGLYVHQVVSNCCHIQANTITLASNLDRLIRPWERGIDLIFKF